MRRRLEKAGPLGKHQLALMAALSVPPLLKSVERVRLMKEKGPRAGFLGVWVTWGKNRIWVPAASLRRLEKRGIYRRGRVTAAAKRAFRAMQARRA